MRRDLLPPSLDDIAALSREALARIPLELRRHVTGVPIRVEDFPDEQTEIDMELESPFDLLGLYRGVSLDRKSVLDGGGDLDMIFLYRRPILDYWAEHEDTLGQIVTHVLVHEIGHHFGLSDADMHRIEEEAAAQ